MIFNPLEFIEGQFNKTPKDFKFQSPQDSFLITPIQEIIQWGDQEQLFSQKNINPNEYTKHTRSAFIGYTNTKHSV